MADDVHPLVHVRGLAQRGEVSLLIDMTAHGDTEVVQAAVNALRQLRARSATSRLVQLLENDDVTIRRMAAHALETIADERTADALLRTLERDDDQPTRWYAATALGRIGDHRAVPVLIEGLSEEGIRDAAVRALGRLGDPRALVPLRELELAPWRWHMRTERRRAVDAITLRQAERQGRVRRPVVDVQTDLWADGTVALVTVAAPIAFALGYLDAQPLPLLALAAAKAVVLAAWLRHIRRRPRRITRWRERARRLPRSEPVEPRARTWWRRVKWVPLFLVVDLGLVWALSLVIGPELAGGLLAGGLGWLYDWRDAGTLRRIEHTDRVRLIREHDSRREDDHRTFTTPS
jgi:hypothetical protein